MKHIEGRCCWTLKNHQILQTFRKNIDHTYVQIEFNPFLSWILGFFGYPHSSLCGDKWALLRMSLLACEWFYCLSHENVAHKESRRLANTEFDLANLALTSRNSPKSGKKTCDILYDIKWYIFQWCWQIGQKIEHCAKEGLSLNGHSWHLATLQ